MGKGLGKVSISISRGISSEIKDVFKDDSPDHRILSIAFDLNKRKNGSPVILVSKDVNLRMKAKALGIPAEDYTTDRITNIEDLYSGKEIVEDFNDDILVKFFQPPFEVNAKEIVKETKRRSLPI